MVTFAKRNVAMLTSVGAMAFTVLLVIFFGAWAVSASSGPGAGGVDGVLTTATSGFTGGYAQPSVPTASNPNFNPDAAPRLASANTAADTWWGKAFLTACPLH